MATVGAGERLGEYPRPWRVFRQAKGARVVTPEGAAYTDYDLCGGTMILGHAPRNVVLAAKVAAERGLNLGPVCAARVDLARQIKAMVPSLELLDFFPRRGAGPAGGPRTWRGGSRDGKGYCWSGTWTGRGVLPRACPATIWGWSNRPCRPGGRPVRRRWWWTRPRQGLIPTESTRIFCVDCGT